MLHALSQWNHLVVRTLGPLDIFQIVHTERRCQYRHHRL